MIRAFSYSVAAFVLLIAALYALPTYLYAIVSTVFRLAWIGRNNRRGYVVLAIVWTAAGGMLALFALLCFGLGASARDLDGRYAGSPLKPWFDHLSSKKGLCCSDADGTALSDPDWKSNDGHYQVRLENRWVDVPDDSVITEPNRAGRTMVWPVYYRGLGDADTRIEIRCFMPGSMG